MANVRTFRVMKDLKQFQTTSLDSGLVLTDYDEESARYFKVSLAGPKDTPYETGTFDVHFKLPLTFPYGAPSATFETPVWHPNIGTDGVVCVDIISAWKPATRLLQLAEVVQALLADPNPNSPLNNDASLEMEENIRVFNRTATMWTCVFAAGSKPRPMDLQFSINSVRDRVGCSEEEALRRLSFAGWKENDACAPTVDPPHRVG